MPYQWLIFDADETLFHFDAERGLKRLFSQYQVDFTRADYDAFQAYNQPLWRQYQAGEIDAKTLQVTRFQRWAERLEVRPETLQAGFMAAMAEICTPMPGVVEMLSDLKAHCRFGIITNGFTALQEARLTKTGLKDLFEFVVISEQVGAAKPAAKIFDAAYQLMAEPAKANVLMVGDNPIADVQGGHEFGFDTCWLNYHNDSAPVTPTIQVANMAELHAQLKLKMLG